MFEVCDDCTVTSVAKLLTYANIFVWYPLASKKLHVRLGWQTPKGTVLVKRIRQNLVPGDISEIMEPVPGPGPAVAVIIIQFFAPLKENLIAGGICALFVNSEDPATIETLIVPLLSIIGLVFIPN